MEVSVNHHSLNQNIGTQDAIASSGTIQKSSLHGIIAHLALL
jgi:hypothetical protein